MEPDISLDKLFNVAKYLWIVSTNTAKPFHHLNRFSLDLSQGLI
jgi:hypothetical protein